jgi:SRSO17 transposase
MLTRNQTDWTVEFNTWLEPYLEALGHPARRRWAMPYLHRLLAPGERKSIRPLCDRIAHGAHEQIHHFVCASPWDTAPLETLLAREAQHLVGGNDAVLIVDDTTLPKKGIHSVGVGYQYSGAVGKMTNCQCLVSITLAQFEVPVPVALRLFVPKEWTDDVDRCDRARIPEARWSPKTKAEIAHEEIDRVQAAGVEFGVVLADAGYCGAEFRKTLSARGFTWAVGVPRTQKVHPLEVRVLPPPRIFRGRRPTHPVVTEDRMSVETALSALPDEAWLELRKAHGHQG